MAAKKKSGKKGASEKKPTKKVVTKAPAKKKRTKKTATKKAPAKKGAGSQLTKAQSKENLNLLIGRAITDRKFRALVTKSLEKAMKQYPLLDTEKNAVLKVVNNPLVPSKAIDQLIERTIGPRGAI